MITALDSSVLWTIIKQEPGHDRWLQTLMQAASDGPLVISPVAFAELAPSTADEAQLLDFLAHLSITYEPISPAAAHLAGLTFKRYRKAGGPRQYLVPDFLHRRPPKLMPIGWRPLIAVTFESGFLRSNY